MAVANQVDECLTIVELVKELPVHAVATLIEEFVTEADRHTLHQALVGYADVRDMARDREANRG